MLIYLSTAVEKLSPAFAYDTATSAIRRILSLLLMLPSSSSIPQCPCIVYGHKQTSHAINKLGNLVRNNGRARMIGFLVLSALLPISSYN